MSNPYSQAAGIEAVVCESVRVSDVPAQSFMVYLVDDAGRAPNHKAFSTETSPYQRMIEAIPDSGTHNFYPYGVLASIEDGMKKIGNYVSGDMGRLDRKKTVFVCLDCDVATANRYVKERALAELKQAFMGLVSVNSVREGKCVWQGGGIGSKSVMGRGCVIA